MSSRLAFDSFGRLVCVDNSTGHVWLVIGNTLSTMVTGDVHLVAWMGHSGRPPRNRGNSRKTVW
jgi:hypothetical protein